MYVYLSPPHISENMEVTGKNVALSLVMLCLLQGYLGADMA